jgi:capsular exopolysaccharide synthesis family protein
LSAREEALRKADRQKEEVRVRGEDLQQLVEDAVRKAIGDSLNEGEFRPPLRREKEAPVAEGGLQLGDRLMEEAERGVPWSGRIHSIAANLKLKMGEGRKGEVLFTSSVSGEGTTTLCAHVARALARIQADEVLLMDCNVLSPGIHHLFNAGAGPGVAEIVQGRMHWMDGIRDTTLSNFHILPFGQTPLEPRTMFSSGGLEKLLLDLKGRFDFIIIDTPPILNSIAAEMMAPWVEGVVLVIKAASTRREVVQRAVEHIKPYREFWGALLNQQELSIPPFLYQRLK